MNVYVRAIEAQKQAVYHSDPACGKLKAVQSAHWYLRACT